MTHLTTGQMILFGVLLLVPIALVARLVVAYVRTVTGRRDAIEQWLSLMRGEDDGQTEKEEGPATPPSYSREQFIQDSFSDLSIDEILERCRSLPPRTKPKKSLEEYKEEYKALHGTTEVVTVLSETTLGSLGPRVQLTGIECLGAYGIAAGADGGQGGASGAGWNGISAGPIVMGPNGGGRP